MVIHESVFNSLFYLMISLDFSKPKVSKNKTLTGKSISKFHFKKLYIFPILPWKVKKK